MKNTIYCFSGTGTALAFAKQVAQEYRETEIIFLPGSDGWNHRKNTEAVGFVFPIHALGLPRVIKKTIAQIDFDNVDYIYAIATMGGSYGVAFEQLKKLLRKKGKNLSASFALSLGGNSNLFLKMGIDPMLSKDEQQRRHEIAMNQVKSIVETVRLRKTVHVSEAKGKLKIISNAANTAFALTLPKYDKNFHTEGCAKCGLCSSSCPSNNIRMSEDGPKWNGHCEACLRCFNICPQKAVLFGKMEDPRMNERYTRYLFEEEGVSEFPAKPVSEDRISM